MKKFIFLVLLLPSMAHAVRISSRTYNYLYNPFSGNLQYVTSIDTNSIKGSGIVVSSTVGGVLLTSTATTSPAGNSGDVQINFNGAFGGIGGGITGNITGNAIGSISVNNGIVTAVTVGTSTVSGTYTPTRSAETNLDSSVVMSVAQFMRVGNTVTVSGRFTADPTLPANTTSFELTLPVASNLGAPENAAGTAFCGNIAGQGAAIFGVAANDTAKVSWVSSDTTSQSWSYIFSYVIF